jgi:hypothetical protein
MPSSKRFSFNAVPERRTAAPGSGMAIRALGGVLVRDPDIGPNPPAHEEKNEGS